MLKKNKWKGEQGTLVACWLLIQTPSKNKFIFFAEWVTAVSAAFCWNPKHCKLILRQGYYAFMEVSCPVLCPQRVLSNLLLRSYCCLPSSFSFNSNVCAQLLSLPSYSTNHFIFHLFLFFLCSSFYLLLLSFRPFFFPLQTLYGLSCPEK